MKLEMQTLKGYLKMSVDLRLKCCTCRKLLKEDEGKYCTACINRQKSTRKHNADNDFHRPCIDCGAEMVNPSPNKKRCEECRDIRLKETADRQIAERKRNAELRKKKIQQPRSCLTCDKLLHNPAPNKKYCDTCRDRNNRKCQERQSMSRAEQRAEMKKQKQLGKTTTGVQCSNMAINPKWLVRGNISNTSNMSQIANS